MPTVFLSRQAVDDIKLHYSKLRWRFGRDASKYLIKNEEAILEAVLDERYRRTFDEYGDDTVFVYRVPGAGQNYYYKITGMDAEVLHASGDALSDERVRSSIDNGISNGTSGYTMKYFISLLDDTSNPP